MATNDGSVLLSCTTTLALGLIQPRTRLEYLPPRASLITSSIEHPNNTKSTVSTHSSRKELSVHRSRKELFVHSSRKEVSAQKSRQESTVHNQQQSSSQVGDKQRANLQSYHDVFNGIGCFQGSPYHIQLDPNVTPKQTPHHFTVQYIPGLSNQLADCLS